MHPIAPMPIAIDQSKLRAIAQHILGTNRLDRAEATTAVSIAQLAAGADDQERPAEHALLQALAQFVLSGVGLRPGEIRAIPALPDHDARIAWFRALSAELRSQAARELAFAFAFLVSVADLELVPDEHDSLEELQHALGVDHRRAMDIVVLLTETVASSH
jgi:tellurite resistance protein